MFFKHLMTKSCFVASLLLVSVVSAATAITEVKPLRVGPVSNYGALGTSGRNVVSIADPSKKVILRGMSLFWSDATGVAYYTNDAVSWAVENLKIDVIRYAMGIQYYKENSSEMDVNYSYVGNPTYQIGYIDDVVRAAIENDIYIIIDWHSHNASGEASLAQSFFATIAQKYAGIPNIIFEVYNEPVNDSWSTIKSYATNVISQIRTYSSNLVLVGTPFYSQNPGDASSNPISATNIAYVLHFYAASHSLSSFSGSISTAMNNGYPVFISEWGTTTSDGTTGANSSASTEWTNYMDQNLISSCNWSFRQYTSHINSTADGEPSGSAFFDGSEALTSKAAMTAASLTTSGTIVKNYLVSKARTWEDTLTAGYRSGSCVFAHQSISEDNATLSGVLNGSCTYTSSNSAVAFQSGTDIVINAAGYTVFTGNDGSKSVVTVTSMPLQTFTFKNLTCFLNKTCQNTNKLSNYSGASDSMEWKLSRSTTIEGSTITYTSNDPSIVTVGKNGTVTYYRFTGKIGSATVTATAPAVTGYRAVDSTVTVSYFKNTQKIASNFASSSVALGSSTDLLPATAIYESAPITYIFGDAGLYSSQSGTYFVAGNMDATVTVTASVAETTNYQAMEKSIEVIIGTGVGIHVTSLYSPFRLDAVPNGILLNLAQGGLVTLQFFDVSGKSVKMMQDNYSAGEHWISLESMNAGHYYVRIQQGSTVKGFRWTKR